MILSIKDKIGNPIDNFEVYFRYKDTHKVFKTNANGLMALTGLEKGAVVNCYIVENESKTFEFDENTELTITFDLPTEDMRFVVAQQNGDAASGLEIHFEYGGNVIVHKTDNTGQIMLNEVPINTKIKVFQVFRDEELNTELFLCERDKAQYFYVADQLFEKSTLKLKLLDNDNQPIKNSDIRFKLEDKEFETVTDQQGLISIENVKMASVVECKQLMFGKALPWHKFIFDDKNKEYVIHGEKQVPFDDNKNTDPLTTMKIRLVNSKSEPIANAIIALDYAGQVRKKYTNPNGEIQIDDVAIGEKIKVFVDVRGNSAEAAYIAGENNETHEIILKTDSGKLFAWLIPLILIVGLIILYGQSNMKNLFTKKKKIEPVVVVKDTVIIKNYQITVKDKLQNKGLKNSKVALVYKDTSYVKLCDSLGMVTFNALNGQEPLQIISSSVGYHSKTSLFKTDSLFNIYLNKNDSIDIAPDYLDCGFLTQSEGSNITYRTFRMKTDKGRFKLFYNMFSLPDQITVYNGAVQTVSENKIIFDSKKMITGLKTLYVNFESTDSLITVKITGKDKDTKWLYKVFCPKKQYLAKPTTIK